MYNNERLRYRLAAQWTNTYLYSYAHSMDDPSCVETWDPPEFCPYVFHTSEEHMIFRTEPLLL